MSTPYVFAEEVPTLLSVANLDLILIWDTSAGLMKRCTVSAADAIVDARGTSSGTTVGYYGITAVDQGTFAATAKTAIATAAVFSAGSAAGTWAWSVETQAQAFMTRALQCQTDLLTLMRRVNSLGIVAISGLP